MSIDAPHAPLLSDAAPAAAPMAKATVPVRLAQIVRRHAALALLTAAGLFLLAVMFRPVIEGDGVGYYSFLHAAFVSHNLSFESEYAAATASGTPLYLPWVTVRTPSGHLTDRFPVGAAVLSAPAYLVALALHPDGEPQYGSPFVQAFTVASLFYGLTGLAICFSLTAAVQSRRSAFAGVVTAVFGTPFVYYMLSDPSYSHAFSVFCVAAFLYAWWKGPPTTYRGWLLLGVLGGVMGMTRWQDAGFMALLLIDLRKIRRPALMFIPGVVIGIAPQLFADWAQFGSLLPQRPPGQELNPMTGNYLGILFSSYQGLFVWTPSAIFAALGVLWLKDRRLQLACLIGFVVQVLIIGAAPDSAGSAIGSRRFLDLLPLAVLGLAALLDRIGTHLDWPLAGVLCLWNLVLVANYEYLLPSGDPGFVRLTIGQFVALPYLPRLFAKGAVLRDLALWSPAHSTFQPLSGLSYLALEAACLVAAGAIAWLLRSRETQLGAR